MESTSNLSCAIQIRELHKRYRAVVSVENISLDVLSGQIFGLVGPDGAGKSTILKSISGVLTPDKGTCRVFDNDVLKDPESVRGLIGFMPQGLGIILSDKLTVLQNLNFFADIFKVDRKIAKERSELLLKVTNLRDFKNRLAGNLSGGMQQKLALCCTLIHHPKILILDEPTTGVDPISRRDIWVVLNDLVINENITILIATSYLDEAERCHRIAMVHNGKILLKGDPINLLSQGEIQELSQLFVRELEGESEHHYLRADLSRLAQKDLRPAKKQDESVIRVIDLTKKFGSFTAVDSINFDIKSGEIFGFLGPNGAGKTTTIKMLCGIMAPTDGEGFVAGYHIKHQRKLLKNRIGYMSQKFSLYRDLKVSENLALYRSIYGKQDHPVLNVSELLDMVGLKGFENRMTNDLPVGLQQRLALACAVVHLPDVLFLDEPTSGVDPLARERFWEIVRFLSRELGITLLLTTHYMDEAEFCDRLAMIDMGKLVAIGTLDELKTKTEQEKGVLIEIVCPQYLQARDVLEKHFAPIVFFGRKLHLFSKQPDDDIKQIEKLLSDADIIDRKAATVPVKLEDAFIHFIG